MGKSTIIIIFMMAIATIVSSFHMDLNQIENADSDRSSIHVSAANQTVLATIFGAHSHCPVDGHSGSGSGPHHCHCSHFFLLKDFAYSFVFVLDGSRFFLEDRLLPSPYLEVPTEPPIFSPLV